MQVEQTRAERRATARIRPDGVAGHRPAHHAGLAEHLEPEVELVTAGVETDVLGFDLDQIAPADRAAAVAAHPPSERSAPMDGGSVSE